MSDHVLTTTALPRAPRSAVLAAGAISVLAALVAGWLTPRGAVTSVQAVITIVMSLCVGLVAGWLMRSRWAYFTVLVTYMLVFELARMRVGGPTVDRPRVDSVYGIMALVVGRGIDALLVLLPMAVGVAHGIALARRARPHAVDRRTWLRHVRRGTLALGSLAVVLLVVGLLRPASTDPIRSSTGEPAPNSVAEIVSIDVGGHDQAVMLRGSSADAPVLLFLEGGPGGTALGRIRRSGTALEQDFVVATWDQRGSGKSYSALDPTSTLTVDQMVEDTLAVASYLRERFDEDKVYLVGSSWGSMLGVRAVHERPEMFRAYVGTGQMVDPFETDALMYAEALKDAESTGDDRLANQLRSIGAPPYEDTLAYPVAVASNAKWMSFTHGEDYNPASEYPFSLFVPEYTLIEQLRGMGAIADTFAVLYPQLEDVDFRRDARELDVPVYLVQGKYEAAGRAILAEQWFADLSAPVKQLVVFDRSGHTPQYDEPGRFAQLMAEVDSALTPR